MHTPSAGNEQPARYCPWAMQFAARCETILAQLMENPTRISISQAKVILVDTWWSYRMSAPKAHRNRWGRKRKHMCINHIYIQAMQRLNQVEVRESPPRIVGIWLGEE